MSHHLPPSSASSNLAVGALLASAIAAGFLLFPGCSRCCPDRAAAMPMPRPTVTATASATVVVAPAAAKPADAGGGGDGGGHAPAKAESGGQDGGGHAPAKAESGGQNGGGHAPAATLTGADAEAAKHVHNYFRLSPNLASGASPESEADFAALAKAGIKSIVSVDGAKPPADLARKYGLRYVHVPIGYDGIPPATALELAKTFVTLHKDGPIFVHCHHGKHRGPAACSIGRMMIDGVSAEETTAWMKVAGTDPKYSGLYATVREFNPPSEADLATVEATMPEAAPTPPLREAMVAVDHHWDALKLVKKAGWVATAEHADIDPAHEASILAEAFRELARQPAIAEKPDDFKAWLKSSEDAAWALSKALAKGAVDTKAADAQFKVLADDCTACHKAHRDHALGK